MCLLRDGEEIFFSFFFPGLYIQLFLVMNGGEIYMQNSPKGGKKNWKEIIGINILFLLVSFPRNIK